MLFRSVIISNTEGIHNLSMSKIAKAADISSATVYTYFNSKEDMLADIFDYLQYASGKALFCDVSDNKTIKREYFYNSFKPV